MCCIVPRYNNKIIAKVESKSNVFGSSTKNQEQFFANPLVASATDSFGSSFCYQKKNPLNILHIFLFKDLFFQVNLRITYVKSQCYVISAMISGKNSSITANIKNPFFFKRLADSHIITNKQSLSDMFVFLRGMCKFAKKILPTRYL